MSKRLRQYLGLVSSIGIYCLIHEGAHLLCALFMGVYKQTHFMGLGIQIDVYADQMTASQMGIFCLAGSLATAITAWILIASANRITTGNSPIFKACMYYTTLAMLLIDPLYLSILCGFFGGGDMNGICLLISETIARTAYGCLLLFHSWLFFKVILPKYKTAF